MGHSSRLGPDRVPQEPAGRDNAVASERLHDDEDSDLAFIDGAAAPDPPEDEDPGGMDEDDNIPGDAGKGSSTSGEPHPPLPGRPNPEPDRTDKPDPDDGGAAPPADEKDQREKHPGRARQSLGRPGLVKAAA